MMDLYRKNALLHESSRARTMPTDRRARRRARRAPDSPLVFHRDGIPVRRWRTAWRTACQAAGVPTRFPLATGGRRHDYSHTMPSLSASRM